MTLMPNIYWWQRRALGLGMVILGMASPAMAGADEYPVLPGESWSHLAEKVGPGDVIVLLPGKHLPGSLSGLSGTEDAPIVIRGAKGEEPAVIVAENTGLHLQRPRWVVLEDLVIVGAKRNGINIDDQDGSRTVGQPWDAQLVLRRVTVRETGPRGNADGIKLSGLRGVRLEDCLVEGWGGSAVDMVGCHDVVIEGSTFRGMDGYSQASGVQAKGGSTNILISGCRFEDAGTRGVNLGGSTGIQFFRPPVPKDAEAGSWWEAEDVVVEGCVFIAGDSAVAIVGARGAVVRRCTIVGTRRWPFRLLQETQDARFGASEGAAVSDCIITPESMRAAVNVGGGTDPGAFSWGQNVWWAQGLDAGRLQRSLPGEVVADQIVRDPRLNDELQPREASLQRFGAGG